MKVRQLGLSAFGRIGARRPTEHDVIGGRFVRGGVTQGITSPPAPFGITWTGKAPNYWRRTGRPRAGVADSTTSSDVTCGVNDEHRDRDWSLGAHTSSMSSTDPTSTQVRPAIASAPMFDGLDRAHVDFLAAQSQAVFVPSGQVLFRKGTPSTGFYVVCAGRMQLSVSNSEGLVKVLEILSPGSAFGHAVMFVHEPYPVDATALADAQLVFVPAAAVERLLDDDPAMARIMLASLARRLQNKIQDIAMLSLQSATQRILAYILGAVGAGSYDLGEGGGAPDSDAAERGKRSTSIKLPALKQVLASRLGMTPETFSRVVRDLSEKGLIRASGAVIEIPDVPALDAYARSGPFL